MIQEACERAHMPERYEAILQWRDRLLQRQDKTTSLAAFWDSLTVKSPSASPITTALVTPSSPPQPVPSSASSSFSLPSASTSILPLSEFFSNPKRSPLSTPPSQSPPSTSQPPPQPQSSIQFSQPSASTTTPPSWSPLLSLIPSSLPRQQNKQQ